MATTEFINTGKDLNGCIDNSNDVDNSNINNHNNHNDLDEDNRLNDNCLSTSNPKTATKGSSLYCFVDEIPYEIIVNGIVSFLEPKDALNLSVTCTKLVTSAVSLPQITLFEHEICWLGPRNVDNDLPRYSGYIIPVIMKHRVQSITLSCKWNDQGLGNQKGKLYIIGVPMSKKDNTKNNCIDNDNNTNKDKTENGNHFDDGNDNRITSDADITIDTTHSNYSDPTSKEIQEIDGETEPNEQRIESFPPSPEPPLFPVKNCRIVWESSTFAPHQESELFATFVPREDEIYHLWYKVGGGGHELFVKQCHVHTIIHEDENTVHYNNDAREKQSKKKSTEAEKSKSNINSKRKCEDCINQSGNNISDSIIESRRKISNNYRILQQTTNMLLEFNKLIKRIHQRGMNDNENDNENKNENNCLKNSSSNDDGHFFVELLLKVIQSLLVTTPTTNNQFTSFLSSYGIICHDRSNLVALEEIILDYLQSYQSICTYYKENEETILDLYRQGLNTDININDIDANNFFTFFENELAVLVDDNIIEAQLVAAREQERELRQRRRMKFRFPSMTKLLSRLLCGRRRQFDQSQTSNYTDAIRVHADDNLIVPVGGHR